MSLLSHQDRKMPSTKPKLAQLQTPMTATFPSELSALSAKTPLSAFPSAKTPLSGFPLDLIKQEDIKTPITPPTAYTDFLKSMSMASPGPGSDKSGRASPTSAPSTSSSEHSDCSCNCDTHKSPTSTVAPLPTPLPTSTSFTYPSSARSTSWLGRLRIPPSPSFSGSESPLSAPLSSAVRSPFSARSARSTRSPYDWDAAAKGRYFDVKSPRTTTKSVREVREIVTRTVTYTSTPRMSPAPKGKRRKIE
ncbi:hypothetical protein B0O99DRAFT_680039 [Bisporella sp. PMI_857]|nr:hypothetical protein B0O99DRAFT_680039 [Bisporella sp. PMI_857]